MPTDDDLLDLYKYCPVHHSSPIQWGQTRKINDCKIISNCGGLLLWSRFSIVFKSRCVRERICMYSYDRYRNSWSTTTADLDHLRKAWASWSEYNSNSGKCSKTTVIVHVSNNYRPELAHLINVITYLTLNRWRDSVNPINFLVVTTVHQTHWVAMSCSSKLFDNNINPEHLKLT